MKLFKKNDLIVIAAVAVLCIAGFLIPKLVSSDKLTADIYVDGNVYQQINLADVQKEYFIDIDSHPNVRICVDKNSICFDSAQCKDKLCVKTGKLTASGQTAACLPARVVIVVNGSHQKNDMLTY